MANALDEDAIRAAALEWLALETLDGEQPIERERLANDFAVDGVRFPLIDRGRGIRKPLGWRSALSITTAFPKSGVRPYLDDVGPDGLERYKFRRDQGGSAENESLRTAVRDQVPLIWFRGVAAGIFIATSPVYLIAEERAQEQFVVAATEAQRLVDLGSPLEISLRRYLLRQTRQRLHQPAFAYQVMTAYTQRCAVCSLNHRELLDAAHIVPDTHPNGLPVVSNGLALCKIHHAAYDRNVLGIRPDGVVQIAHRLLAEVDGPMLRHGLQDHHGRALMVIPRRSVDRPDPVRLEERYAEFSAA